MAQLGHEAGTAALRPLMSDLEKRLQWMDERGVQMHVLTLSGSMPWQWASQDEANRLARIVNDAAIEAHKAYPDRFVAGVAMPMRDPAAALRELDRVAGEPGIRAVHLPNSVEGHDYIFEPAYLPILARCEELGYPLLFHPLDGVENHYGGPERLAGATFIYNTLGFPVRDRDHWRPSSSFSGLLDKFPKLDIVLPHSGGCFPYIAGRIEHSIKKGAANIELKHPFQGLHPALPLRHARLLSGDAALHDRPRRIGPRRHRHRQLRQDGRRPAERAGAGAESPRLKTASASCAATRRD